MKSIKIWKSENTKIGSRKDRNDKYISKDR